MSAINEKLKWSDTTAEQIRTILNINNVKPMKLKQTMRKHINCLKGPYVDSNTIVLEKMEKNFQHVCLDQMTYLNGNILVH